MKKLIVPITIFLLMISCCIDTNVCNCEDDSNKEETITETLTNTLNKTLYLVKMNSTSKIVSKDDSGYVSSDTMYSTDDNENYTTQNSTKFIKEDNHLALTFYPEHISTFTSTRSFNHAKYDVGDIKKFWIMKNNPLTMEDIEWEELPATLRIKSNFCNIWVPDEYWEKGYETVSKSIVTKLAEKFDSTYPLITNVFGYANNESTPINILVFDICSDHKQGTIFGYFMPKDYGEYDEIYHSNECCMFYLDAYLTRFKPKMAYSTLAHEFQHMINYYNKTILNEKDSETWFTEMLSMLCEDMLQTFLEISNDDSPIGRLPYFNDGYYKNGVTEWQNSQYSYACTYAFGAYLVRNFGGIKLLSEIGKNKYTNKESITQALKALNYNETFDSIFLKFAEALIYEDSNKLTFNKSCTETLNGYKYAFKAFNIWKIERGSFGLFMSITGPQYFLPTQSHPIRPYGFTIHTQENWKNINTDSLTVSITKPKNSTIKYRFILK